MSDENSGSIPCLPWILSDDQSGWTAPLPDGRTASIERLDGGLFRPRVGEHAGPVCAGVLAAAQWAVESAPRDAW